MIQAGRVVPPYNISPHLRRGVCRRFCPARRLLLDALAHHQGQERLHVLWVRLLYPHVCVGVWVGGGGAEGIGVSASVTPSA